MRKCNGTEWAKVNTMTATVKMNNALILLIFMCLDKGVVNN